MKDKISVVIPTYNLEKCLGPTLDSVLAQTHENLEIIIVDDGSHDGTAAVIEAYAARDSRIRAVYKENGGVTSARLRGVAEATGVYIGFVDGDDYIEPEMYEFLLRNLKKHDADISHCGYQMVFPGGRIDYYYNTGRQVVQDGIRGCADLLDGRYIEPSLVNKLYYRELFTGLDAWMDRSVRNMEDLLMNFYLFRRAKRSVFEDICLYHYVLRKGSAATSRINEHKLKDPLKVMHILMEETKSERNWHTIVTRRLSNLLINGATIALERQNEWMAPFRRSARKELRQRLAQILKEPAFGLKLKIMALWASVWPAGYGWVHRAYARMTGLDKKFEVR